MEIPKPKKIHSSLSYEESDHWYMCNTSLDSSQGWKVYVSCTILNIESILYDLSSILVEHEIAFKYVKNVKMLKKLNAGRFGYAQIGKSIVLYLPAPSDEFICKLIDCAGQYRSQSPTIPYAKHLGGDLPLYYRYGSYQDDFITIDGENIRDQRSNRDVVVPHGMVDVFSKHQIPDNSDARLKEFLLNYPVFDAIIQRGKGGIFRGLNLNNPQFQEVVLKFAYPNGQVQYDGTDGRTLLRREIDFSKIILEKQLTSVAVQMIDCFDDYRNVIGVFESLKGPDLLSLKMTNQLTLEHVRHCWDTLTLMHSHGLYIGDAKLANFLLNDDGLPILIDFETNGVIGHPEVSTTRTFFIINPQITDPKIYDYVHFIISVLYPYESHSGNSEIDRTVDAFQYLDSISCSEVDSWAKAKLTDILRQGTPWKS